MLILSLESAGAEIPEEWRRTDYPAGGDPVRLRGFLEWFGEETRATYDDASSGFIRLDGSPFSPEAGDFPLFSVRGIEAHTGILTLPNRVVHAWYPNRSVVEHDLSGPWRKRVVSFFRCKLSLA